MTETDPSAPPICIVVPFANYTNSAAPFLKSLAACSEELKDLRCALILIASTHAVGADNFANEFLPHVPYIHLHYEQNRGFSHAANLGLKQAADRHADVILLHPDTTVSAGAIREMQRVACLDSMIGFVSPRSNGVGISSFPPQQEFQNASPGRAQLIFKELSHYLPELQYVPAASAGCVYIKLEILREFGLFDAAYENSDEAINDLAMRANRCGYRAALANHAFVYHAAPAFQPDTGNASTARYPEYARHLEAYFDSAPYQAELLLAGLLKDDRGRLSLVFDFSSFGAYHNGTFEAAKQTLIHAATSWKDTFDIHVLVDDEPARFHRLHQIENIHLVPLSTHRVFAVAFRIGQPFDFDSILRMSRLAVFNVYTMLDPIAWDCLYLQNPQLDQAWRAVFSHADGITYLSDFVARQFHLRFRPRLGLKELVAYPSLDARDYLQPGDASSPCSDYLLVVGNAFSHKNVRPTVEILTREFPEANIVALGLEDSPSEKTLTCKSGHLSDQQLHDLFLRARTVIFPSFYEGFGLPIVRGLAYRKPVLARSTQLNCDVFERLGRPDDLILYDSTDHLISLLRSGSPNWKGSVAAQPDKHDWADSTQQIGEFLLQLVQQVSYTGVLIPRLEYMNLLRRAFEPYLEAPSLAPYEVKFLQLQKEISELRIAVQDKDLQIRSLVSSLSWAVTAPMRTLGALWLRVFGGKARKRSA